MAQGREEQAGLRGVADRAEPEAGEHDAPRRSADGARARAPRARRRPRSPTIAQKTLAASTKRAASSAVTPSPAA